MSDYFDENLEKAQLFMHNIVDKNGYPYAAGYFSSVIVGLLREIPEERRKEVVERYIKA